MGIIKKYRDYLYIVVITSVFVLLYLSNNDNNLLIEKNRKIEKREKELKELSVYLENKVKKEQESKLLLTLRIDSIKKIKPTLIYIKTKNEKKYKEKAIFIDSVATNELISLFTN